MKSLIIALTAAAASLVTSLASGDYERAGSVGDMPLGGAGSRGVATILDERTIRVHDLYYNGKAPLVYFYLGRTNTYVDFLNGIPIGPVLDELDDDCMTVQLPEGETLDDWNAIAIWCEALDILFTSAAFEDPDPAFCPADLDGNRVVEFADILAVLEAWGECPPEPPECCYQDLDISRTVDFADLLVVLGAWGPCD